MVEGGADTRLTARVVAIFGPTAIGKTAVALELAELLRARGADPVAVSADAIQVYEGLEILAGAPSPEQLAQLEHRLLALVPLDRTFSVAEFSERAHGEIESLLWEGRTPIVVGGTGLYLRAALASLDLKPPPDPDLRAEVERELERLGPARLHACLSAATAELVHPNDRKRIARARELERMGERPHADSDQLWSDSLRYPAALFGLVVGRDELAKRIERRVEVIVETGAIDEVEHALAHGISKTARKALGFKELATHLYGELERSEAVALMKRRQLAYAKRQLTWMRKLAHVELVDRTGMEDREVAELIAERLGAQRAFR